MIKIDGRRGHLEIDGIAPELIAELSILFIQLNKKMDKDTYEKFKNAIIEMLNMAPLMNAGMTVEEANEVLYGKKENK